MAMLSILTYQKAMNIGPTNAAHYMEIICGVCLIPLHARTRTHGHTRAYVMRLSSTANSSLVLEFIIFRGPLNSRDMLNAE